MEPFNQFSIAVRRKDLYVEHGFYFQIRIGGVVSCVVLGEKQDKLHHYIEVPGCARVSDFVISLQVLIHVMGMKDDQTGEHTNWGGQLDPINIEFPT